MNSQAHKLSKGARTAQRILDVAEQLFAQRGYSGTSLREIAKAAKITEPALYNHFRGKEALYQGVLQRGLQPLLDGMEKLMQESADISLMVTLPSSMTDMLAEHPHLAALFHRALLGGDDSAGQKLMDDWLSVLFDKGAQLLSNHTSDEVNSTDSALYIIALFNLCTGYFLSQRIFQRLTNGSVLDAESLQRQKKLLSKITRAMTLG